MNVAIGGGRKGIYACTFFMAGTTSMKKEYKSIYMCVLQHISFGDERKGKEPNFILLFDKDHRIVKFSIHFCMLKFNGIFTVFRMWWEMNFKHHEKWFFERENILNIFFYFKLFHLHSIFFLKNLWKQFCARKS